MTKQYTLPLSSPRAKLALAGGKGASLARLLNAGLPVPDGFHVTTAAYRCFVDENALQPRILEALQAVDIGHPATLESAAVQIAALFAEGVIPAAVAAAVKAAYATLDSPAGDLSKQASEPLAVAVRSSATAEDLPSASFAGQQETFLNVSGSADVLSALKRCWASLWTARAIAYRVRQSIAPGEVLMAVVVQRLVSAEAAGILFTANPLNGRRDQIVINAAWGLGEAVVGGQVTPDQWVVDKKSGRVLSREVADKAMMTVLGSQGCEQAPVPEDQRRKLALTEAALAALVGYGKQIEAHYQTPVDIEFAVAEPSEKGAARVFILQARPITALPEPLLERSFEWAGPDPQAIYYRSSIAELLPDPLTPLFATLGGRLINRGTLQLFSEIVGPGVLPDEMFVTLNGYAYYTMQMTFKFWRRVLINMWSFFPKFLHGEERWRDEALPRYLSVIERWQSRPLREVSAPELLDGVSQIFAEAVNIYNIFQSGVVGLATLAEMGFVPFYEKLIRQKCDPAALTLMLGGDSMPLRAEKSLYDVAKWCLERPGITAYLTQVPSARLAAHLRAAQVPADTGDADVDGDVWCAWQSHFQAYLVQYGHVAYDLDFSKPLPIDDPTPLLETLKLYLLGQGRDPHARQQKQLTRRKAASQAIVKRLKGWRLKWFQKLLGWAQLYVPMREDNLADISLGYPLLRQMLHELGRRLVQAGVLAHVDDVYWLKETEVVTAVTALERDEALGEMQVLVEERKAEWRAAKRVTPPAGLPERSGMTNLLSLVGPSRVQKEGHTLKGVGASPGRITLPACVLHGPEDFGKMQPGAALVAAITTPAWTPLFAMAAAVVTDIGGPLSHGSIVAREYGIPAVLGTAEATRRIQHGQFIRVDGDAGTVTLLGEAGEELHEEASASAGSRRVRNIVIAGLAVGAAVVALLWWRKRRRQRLSR